MGLFIATTKNKYFTLEERSYTEAATKATQIIGRKAVKSVRLSGRFFGPGVFQGLDINDKPVGPKFHMREV